MDNKRLDEAVEVLVTRLDLNPDYFGTEEIRESFLAGVKVLLGEVAEVVGEMTDYIDQEVDPELDVVERWRDQMRSYLNAPSLGEGDGR